MQIADLLGRRVALYGLGVEGRAVLRALRRLAPTQPVTILQDTPVTHQPVDSYATYIDGPSVTEALAAHEIIILSPGISLYRPAIQAARQAGIIFTSSINLWLAAPRRGRVLAITGTKGKSTSAALAAHLWRASGARIALGGNIGTSPLDWLPEQDLYDGFVLELSSYQCAQLVGAVDAAILLNLSPAHLAWHGTMERYAADKARLLTAAPAGGRVVPTTDYHPALDGLSGLVAFAAGDPYAVREQALWQADALLWDGAVGPLRGAHNAWNLAAVLTGLKLLGVDGPPLLPALADFQPLPHRLQELGDRHGILYINDSIATVPEAMLAALACYPQGPLALLLGGAEQQQDYAAIIAPLLARPALHVITCYQNGPRINTLLQVAGMSAPRLHAAPDLATALPLAQSLLPAGGVVLLSPAAPSTDAFANFQARGATFAALAGLPLRE